MTAGIVLLTYVLLAKPSQQFSDWLFARFARPLLRHLGIPEVGKEPDYGFLYEVYRLIIWPLSLLFVASSIGLLRWRWRSSHLR